MQQSYRLLRLRHTVTSATGDENGPLDFILFCCSLFPVDDSFSFSSFVFRHFRISVRIQFIRSVVFGCRNRKCKTREETIICLCDDRLIYIPMRCTLHTCVTQTHSCGACIYPGSFYTTSHSTVLLGHCIAER